MTHFSKYLLAVVTLFVFQHAQAQEKVFEPKGSWSIDVGIPAQGRNESFGRVMNGLFNGGGNFQYNVWEGITIGLGVKYSYFIINPFALNNSTWRGGLHIPSGYGKVGYEKFITERFSINASARMGYSMMVSINDTCKVQEERPFTDGAFFVEPQVELLFTTDKGSPHGFSLMVGYNFIFSEFGPQYLCMDEIPNLFEEDYQGITRFFSFGFGYRYYLGRN